MVRKLASVQVVEDIRDIPDADRIVSIKVLGWRLVARREEFKVGDKCVFFEVDSVLPQDNTAFDFLGRKRRIKTVKMRGSLSQGLAMPLSTLGLSEDLDVGTDVTEELNVTKHDPSLNQPFYKGLTQARVRTFPMFIPRTDEPRVQSFPEVLEEIKHMPVYITTKLDGTSMTVYHYDGEYGVCSRNMTLDTTHENKYNQIANALRLEEKLKSEGNYALQGELVGAGIQGNPLGMSDNDFYVFQVFDIDNQRYLDYHDMVEFCISLSINTVPVDYSNVMIDWDVDMAIEEAKGHYKTKGFHSSKKHREGIVVRPMFEKVSGALRNRMSFKVINNDYLLSGN